MSISAVRSWPVAVPLRIPTSIATRVVTSRQYLLVQLEGSDGVTGTGYAYIGTSGARAAAAVVDDIFAPVLTSSATSSPVALWARLYQESLLTGRRGIVVRVLSAIDIALWDLQARRSGVPLANLLGGDHCLPVPAYASGGYYRPSLGNPADYVRREIEENQAAGFTDHKLKVGGLPLAEDVARVAAASALIGEDGRLALDANNAYATVHDAAQAVRAFEDASNGLWWFEEPFSPDRIEFHHELAELVETPIATGEIHQTRWEFRDLIADRGLEILQPDVGVLGGITEWLRVANLASSFDRPVAPHWHANVHAHLASAVDNCITVEHFVLDKDIYNFEDLLVPETRLAFKNGALLLSDRPGLGIEIDHAKVDQYRMA